MVAMFIGLMGAPLLHRTRLTVIIVDGLIISLVTNLVAARQPDEVREDRSGR